MFPPLNGHLLTVKWFVLAAPRRRNVFAHECPNDKIVPKKELLGARTQKREFSRKFPKCEHFTALEQI